MRDFTLKMYLNLIESLKLSGYQFSSLEDYFLSSKEKCVILRHDVDSRIENSLIIAKLENELAIKGTYYFRTIKSVYKESIIRKIADLGHEIGYHYETVDRVINRRHMKFKKFDFEKIIDEAYELFLNDLEKIRRIVPIKTICMHGSPLSKYDNRLIWDKYDYQQVGIIGEPYLNIDFNTIAYFTDTGRCWNGTNTSRRDKVNSVFFFNFKTTFDFIENIGSLPDKLMITIHPQRWTDNNLIWVNEFVIQNLKNIIKFYLFK